MGGIVRRREPQRVLRELGSGRRRTPSRRGARRRSDGFRKLRVRLGRGEGEMVMIMQPDAARLLLDEEILAALGYEPVGVRDPSEALRMCRSDPGRFHAMLICPQPGTSGALELAARVREVAPALPILLAIPSARYLDPAQLVDSGVSELLHYPLVSSPLSNALSRAGTPAAALH